MGVVLLRMEAHNTLQPLPPMKTQEVQAIHQEESPRGPCWSLDLGLPTFRAVANTFLLFISHPVWYFVTAAEQTKTEKLRSREGQAFAQSCRAMKQP